MKLQDIFEQLSGGEFSQLSIGGQDAGVINANNYAKVLGHVNLGLTALYRRFTLKEGRLILQMQEGQTKYKLMSPYAVNAVGSSVPVRYIIDTVDDPFQDDIIKIERVLDELGEELGLNDASDPLSVFTPSALTLQLPTDPAEDKHLEVQALTVVYRANHPKLVVGAGEFTPAAVEVQLPDTHMEPLLYYVASRVNNPVGMSNEFHAGNSYYAKYEAACQELEGKGLQVNHASVSDRLARNGWV